MIREAFQDALQAAWDCKHFVWNNCPVAKQGQHKGHADGGKHTKILEAIADDSCYFWFVNFGDPGSCNDINVLDKSSIVGALCWKKLLRGAGVLAS
jgi:Plant transposon protein